MNITPDHIRTLASWLENLKVFEAAKAGFVLYHNMTLRKATDAEISNTFGSLVKILQYNEPDKKHFYSVMRAWGVID